MLRVHAVTLCADDEGQVPVVWCGGDGERVPLQCRDARDVDGNAVPWVVPASAESVGEGVSLVSASGSWGRLHSLAVKDVGCKVHRLGFATVLSQVRQTCVHRMTLIVTAQMVGAEGPQISG